MRSWLAMLALLAGSLQAAPACVSEALPQARLSGQGGFTYFGLAIYDAELWVGPDGYRPGAALALELRYARKLDGRKIAEASAEQMAQTGAGTRTQRAEWLGRMAALFPDVREGSRICGVALADGSSVFYLDDKPLGGVIAAPAFTRAFFGIWLSPASTAGNLRAQLLRDAAPR